MKKNRRALAVLQKKSNITEDSSDGSFAGDEFHLSESDNAMNSSDSDETIDSNSSEYENDTCIRKRRKRNNETQMERNVDIMDESQDRDPKIEAAVDGTLWEKLEIGSARGRPSNEASRNTVR